MKLRVRFRQMVLRPPDSIPRIHHRGVPTGWEHDPDQAAKLVKAHFRFRIGGILSGWSATRKLSTWLVCRLIGEVPLLAMATVDNSPYNHQPGVPDPSRDLGSGVGQALGLRRPLRPPKRAFNNLRWVFDRASPPRTPFAPATVRAPRAAAILVRSGFVTRNPALSARPSSFRFARYTSFWRLGLRYATTRGLSERRLPTRAVSSSRGAVQGPVTSRLAPIAARALPSQKGSLCAGETGRR